MASNVRPIKPNEVTEAKKTSLPDEVLEAFNELIVKNLSGNYATIKQDDVVELMVSKGLKRGEIFENHWLDIEELYETEGWKVEYDRPGYCESYPATFTFSRRSRNR